jgi:di/tripeptidase
MDSQRLLNTFLRLVCIDSETGFENEMAKQIANELEETGFEITVDKAGEAVGHRAAILSQHEPAPCRANPL